MSPAIPSLRHKFQKLSRIGKLFSIALVLQAVYSLFAVATGVQLTGWYLVRAFFILTAIPLLFRLVLHLNRKLLWRVRHRLLVTWFLVGIVPIVLITALVTEGLYILMGQGVGYMTDGELRRQEDRIRSSAESLSWSVAHRTTSASLATVVEPFVVEAAKARKAEVGAIVRAGKEYVVSPSKGGIAEIPKWSKPGSAGLIHRDGRFYFRAHLLSEPGANGVEVFLYQEATPEFFTTLLPDIAAMQFRANVETRSEIGGVVIERTQERRRSGFRINTNQTRDDLDPNLQPPPPPAGRGWWDIAVSWIVPVPFTEFASGKEENALVIVSSRPSLILGKLFSNLGRLAGIAIAIMVVTMIVLLVVEIISLIFGATLTRSITRAVADLYEGTLKVQAGDFAHRIPVRTKDQLSELAGSFNTMTERIQGLIIEAKEKVRLENELKIAQDVQAQLFPKEFPRLKTLELWGGCQPARAVSGDYFDFIAVGPDRLALAIGDVSGKGISAALLMAHIQSGLRSQLMYQATLGVHQTGNGVVSPSSVMTILSDQLYGSSPAEKYATFFLGLYTDESGELSYATAGHLPPMLVRRGEVLRLDGAGFPAGMFPGTQYEQQTLKFEPGDLFVGFTDGVTEAPNENEEEFGDERLTELILRHAGIPLHEIAHKITASIAEWTGDVERHDDTTIILARRL